MSGTILCIMSGTILCIMWFTIRIIKQTDCSVIKKTLRITEGFFMRIISVAYNHFAVAGLAFATGVGPVSAAPSGLDGARSIRIGAATNMEE